MSKIALTPNASGTGTFTLAAPNSNTSRTITLPDEAGEVLVNTATGIDVTGTITSDGLTVEANTATFSSGTSGDMEVVIQADTDNNDEGDSPSLVFKQDGANTIGRLGLIGNADDVFTGSLANALYIGNDENANMQFYTDLKQRLRISNNGDISFYDSTGTTPKFFWDSSAESLSLTTNGTEALDISSTTGAAEIRMGNSNSTFDIRLGAADKASGYADFFVETGGSEAMRIDSSGNLLVGTTNTDPIGSLDSGMRIGDGFFNINRSGVSGYFGISGSYGNILQFYKDGSTVGSIGIQSGGLTIDGEAGHAGLRFGGNDIAPRDNGADVDAGIQIGNNIYRFTDIYATNGTIQTSDRNEKQDIEELNDAETRVAQACKGLLRKFRWQDAVAEKGDDARIHFGIIAQDLQDAFAAEDLDAGRYAMFISSTWWETQTEVPAVEAVAEVLGDDGNVVTEAVEAKDAYIRTDTYETQAEAPEGATERTRLGVRYPELLAFIIGAM